MHTASYKNKKLKQDISQTAYFLRWDWCIILLQVCWNVEMLTITARPYHKFLTSHHPPLSFTKYFHIKNILDCNYCRLFWLSAITTAIIWRVKATFHYLRQNIGVKNFSSSSSHCLTYWNVWGRSLIILIEVW